MFEAETWAIVYSAPEAGSPEAQRREGQAGRDLRARHVGGALSVARTLVDPSRIVVVVLEQERPWWQARLLDLPPENVVEQPFDRGSATGILLAAARVRARAPGARVLVFFSDVIDASMMGALRDGVEHAAADPRVQLLSGSHDARRGGPAAPAVALATASGLLQLFEETQPELVRELLGEGVGPRALDEIYPFLGAVDFRREVLAAAPHRVLARAVDEGPFLWREPYEGALTAADPFRPRALAAG
jgi:hypothetical protein